MNSPRPLFFLALCVPAFASTSRASDGSSEITLTPKADRVRIEIGGKLFAEYIFAGASKPYLYPILAADGTKLNRDYPMAEPPGEEHDHNHHRSLWFGHGLVNGFDFWLEAPQSGKIVQDKLVEAKSGKTGLLQAHHRWIAPDGTEVCTDDTTLRIQAVPGGRILDFDVTLHADHGPLTLGDTKEGAMSMRLAQWMVMPHRAGGKDIAGNGNAVNSEGLRDTNAWGKRAAWVDYIAPHNDKVYGVAMFDHPENPRYPTWWHVRDYGLFAANPFGQHDFENMKDSPHAGDYMIPANGSATFRYRFYFHEGDTAAAHVADRYREFSTGR
jgi:hypothetical protein